jgi:hypothetical protein
MPEASNRPLDPLQCTVHNSVHLGCCIRTPDGGLPIHRIDSAQKRGHEDAKEANGTGCLTRSRRINRRHERTQESRLSHPCYLSAPDLHSGASFYTHAAMLVALTVLRFVDHQHRPMPHLLQVASHRWCHQYEQTGDILVSRNVADILKSGNITHPWQSAERP